MSLVVYDIEDYDKGLIPVEVVDDMIKFFDENVVLENNDLVKELMLKIDGATYIDKYNFQGNKIPKGVAYKEYLSAGLKTILCVLSYPDKCFDLKSCGSNAVQEILKFDNGNVIFRTLLYNSVAGDNCNIKYNGSNFNSIKEFVNWRYDYLNN